MSDFFGLLFIRSVIRSLGLYTRYLFFRLIGKRRGIDTLTSKLKDDDSNLGENVQQEFYNSAIGIIIFIVLSFIIVSIVYR
jgi:hypothetical protein